MVVTATSQREVSNWIARWPSHSLRLSTTYLKQYSALSHGQRSALMHTIFIIKATWNSQAHPKWQQFAHHHSANHSAINISTGAPPILAALSTRHQTHKISLSASPSPDPPSWKIQKPQHSPANANRTPHQTTHLVIPNLTATLVTHLHRLPSPNRHSQTWHLLAQPLNWK